MEGGKLARVTIRSLGRQGDGVAELNGDPVHIPFALPGEAVEVSDDGRRSDILTAAPERAVPPCRHFGRCGGCRMQHVTEALYSEWKLSLVNEPLRRAGITPKADHLSTFPVASRRRAVFSVLPSREKPVLGFAERASNRIADLAECPVLVPAISSAIPKLRAMCNVLPRTRKPGKLTVLATAAGLDVTLSELPRLDGRCEQALISEAIANDWARLSVADETLVELRAPALHIGSAAAVPPPGGFVQAVEAAEALMAEKVCTHLSDCSRVADLYSGVGTFALRLAETAEVTAMEENAPAIAALEKAWRQTAGRLQRIRTEVRNLDRRPMTSAELSKLDGAVFDPPRAGAEAQAIQLASSGIGKVAAVSCNPVTLARDLGHFAEAGYEIVEVAAIDQFRFSHHVEAVVLLERR